MKIILERNETNHKVETIYANLFSNDLVELRRSVRNKLDNNEIDLPDNRHNLKDLERYIEIIKLDS